MMVAVPSRLPALARKLLPFLAWRHRVTPATWRADIPAGLLGALIVLPQAVAFATLAGLPPQYGLYGAMLPAVVGALWGSSWHLVSGPTNATSLMVSASLAALALPFSPQYLQLAITLGLMIGLIKLGLGLARLGALVNFISITVVVGFTAGAALLIIAAQLANFFGVPAARPATFSHALASFGQHLGEVDRWTAAVGTVTVLAALVARRVLPRIPYLLVGMIAGSAFAYALARAGIAQVATVGPLPSALPPLSLPDFSGDTWRRLAPIAVALTLIGLTEAIASARAVAARSGQHIDGNQEFIGQGLANIAGAFSSSYPTSGSFNRTGANYEAGAKTPLAALFSAGFLLLLVLLVAPLAAYLPLAAMAALLFIVAAGLVDVHRIREIVRAGKSEALVLAVTFLATLFVQLEFAILVGVLCSLFAYLNRTTHPAIHLVAPDPASPRRRFAPVARDGGCGHLTECPQLALVRIDGSLFFGAVDHVRDELAEVRAAAPARRHMLLIGSGINFIDVAGAELLAHEADTQRDAGGALYLCNLKPTVVEVLERSGFLDRVGRDRIFANKDAAIDAIYRRLEPAVCRACEARIFIECRERLPDGSLRADSIRRVIP